MNIQEIVLLITTIAGVATSCVLVYKSRAEKRKITHESGKLSAEAAAVISNSAVALLEPMRQEMTILEKRLKEATTRADHLQRLLDVANSDLREANRRLNRAMERIEELEITVTRMARNRSSRDKEK